MKASTTLFAASLACLSWMTAQAQSLLEPDRVDAARSEFESATKATALRCQIRPERPALNYTLQFKSGYRVDIPLNQPGGAGHRFDVLTRVTPEGKPPVYLAANGSILKIPAGPADAEIAGGFAVGEGSYTVEVLVRDERWRACHNQWHVEAKRVGSERDLRSAMPPGAVDELGNPPPSRSGGPEIQRLTILVHAVAMNPRAAKIEETTVRDLDDSVASLVDQLPARSVRLVVFNLERQIVLLSKENFAPRDMEDLTRVLERVQLGILDVKAMEKPVDVLSDLMLREVRDPRPASAVIVISPRTVQQTGSLMTEASGTARLPWYYLQYQNAAAMRAQVARFPSTPQPGPNSGRIPPQIFGSRPPGAANTLAADGIERLVRSLSGAVLPVREPHDLSDAIRVLASEIPTANTPPSTPVTEAAAPRPRPLPPLPRIGTGTPEPGEPAGDEDPVEVLLRLRDRVVERAMNMPNHTCVESVQRDQFQPLSGPSVKSCDYRLAARKQSGNRLRLDLTDWLRLDVGVADGREIFSWAGASKFDEREIDEVIPEGAFGTGPFATMLLSVFMNRNPHFIFDGETTLDSVPVFQYSFRVPFEESHYRVKAHRDWVVTGFSGALMVNPKTADLARFIVRTDELPPATGTCEVDTTLDYAAPPRDGFQYLLPAETRQRFVGIDGSEGENTMSFASCREFIGESTLSFGQKPAAAGFLDGTGSSPALPPGLTLNIELRTPITFGKAAAGDRIEGTLLESVKDRVTQRTVALAGAKVSGRLTRVELQHSGSGQYTIGLRWESLEADSVTIPLNLKPGQPPLVKTAGRGLVRRGMNIELPLRGEGPDAIYHFPEQSAGVSGLRAQWVTTGAR